MVSSRCRFGDSEVCRFLLLSLQFRCWRSIGFTVLPLLAARLRL
jgi:hypothetical protein